MKRLLTCLLALSLLLACIGCGSAAAPSSTEAEDLTIQSGTPRPAGDREPPPRSLQRSRRPEAPGGCL